MFNARDTETVTRGQVSPTPLLDCRFSGGWLLRGCSTENHNNRFFSGPGQRSVYTSCYLLELGVLPRVARLSA